MAKKRRTRKQGPGGSKAADAVRAAMAAWGRKGGKARKKALSPERRREIAVKAIRTRWKDRNPKG